MLGSHQKWHFLKALHSLLLAIVTLLHCMWSVGAIDLHCMTFSKSHEQIWKKHTSRTPLCSTSVRFCWYNMRLHNFVCWTQRTGDFLQQSQSSFTFISRMRPWHEIKSYLGKCVNFHFQSCRFQGLKSGAKKQPQIGHLFRNRRNNCYCTGNEIAYLSRRHQFCFRSSHVLQLGNPWRDKAQLRHFLLRWKSSRSL